MLKVVQLGATKDVSSEQQLGSLQNEVALRVTEYLNSKPGHNSWASNTNLHGSIFAFVSGRPLVHQRPEKLKSMLARLLYRINTMHEAD